MGSLIGHMDARCLNFRPNRHLKLGDPIASVLTYATLDRSNRGAYS